MAVARGFLSGLIWGGVVCTGFTAVVALTAPMPIAPQVQVSGPAVADPPQVEDDSDTPQPTGAAPDTDTVADTPPASTTPVPETAVTETPVPQPDNPPAPPAPPASEASPDLDDALETALQPQVDGTGGSVPASAPQPGTAPDVTARSDTAPQPSGPGTAPAAPVADTDPAVSTVPSMPATPATDMGSAPDAPSETTLDTFRQPAPEDTVPATGRDDGDRQTLDIAAAPEAVPPEPAPAPAIAPQPEPVSEPAQVTETAPQPTPRTRVIAGISALEGDDTGPTIGTRVVPLTERANAGSSRLPALGQVVQAAEPDPVAAPEDADLLPPLERFAAEFDNPEGKPLYSIVLIDGPDSLGAEALSSFPYPLTFAVDPQDPQAAEKAARHRAAGFEVAILVDLSETATPQDAETALSLWQGILPETVAFVEGTTSGFQGNRALSDQVTQIARGEGRGLVTQANGLNTVQKLALRDGVPSAPVFRDFDGAGQTPTVMRRFLDQAAFRAGQDGAVVMLGRVQPDTISALLLWGLQDRADRVQLAPLSALLQDTVAE